MIVKKVLPFLIVIPVLLTFAQIQVAKEELDLSTYHQAAFSMPHFEKDNSEEYIYLSPSRSEDVFSFLYGNTLTRALVVDFFSRYTNSENIANLVLKNASKYDVPVSLAFALCWAESRFSVYAVNRNASSIDRGLFQLNSLSFPHLGVDEFFDPEINVRTGIQHLRFSLNSGRNTVTGLAIYNAGQNRVKATGAPPITLNYISYIFDYMHKIESDFRRSLGAETLVFSSTVNGKPVKYVFDLNL